MVIREVLTKYKFQLTILLIFIAFLAVVLAGNILNKQKEVLVARRLELAKLNRDLERLDKILTDKKENWEKLEIARKTLPASYQDVAYFVSQIERIAKEAGQNLETQIDKTPKDEKVGLLGLRISLQTTGDYKSFSDLLTQISRFPYHTKVEALKIQEIEGNLSAITSLRLYLPKP